MKSIWIVVVNEIWNHRNKIIFKYEMLDYFKKNSLVQLKVWYWITSKVPFACFSCSDWCLDPLICLFSL